MILSNRKFPGMYIYFQLPCWFSGDVYKNTLYHNQRFSDFKKAAMQNVFFIKSRRTLIMLKHVQVGEVWGVFFSKLEINGMCP